MAKNPQVAEYKQLAAQAEQRHGLPKGILSGLFEQESSWNPAAVSGAGAVGLGQIIPSFYPHLDAKRLANDPPYNIESSAKILKDRHVARNGDIQLALVDYHSGQGNVDVFLGKRKPNKGEQDTLGPKGREYAPLIMARSNKYGGEITQGEMDSALARFQPKMKLDTIMRKTGLTGLSTTPKPIKTELASMQADRAVASAMGITPPEPSLIEPIKPIDYSSLFKQPDIQIDTPDSLGGDFAAIAPPKPPKMESSDIFAGNMFSGDMGFDKIKAQVEAAYIPEQKKAAGIPKEIDGFLETFVTSLHG